MMVADNLIFVIVVTCVKYEACSVFVSSETFFVSMGHKGKNIGKSLTVLKGLLI